MKRHVSWFLGVLIGAIAIALAIGHQVGVVAGIGCGSLTVAMFVILSIVLRLSGEDKWRTQAFIVAVFAGFGGFCWMMIDAMMFVFRSEWFGGRFFLHVIIGYAAAFLGGAVAWIQHRRHDQLWHDQ